ncbi:hypothetical protein Syun_019514 [Stephania yunnanensis]|uniref:Protein kinase domain-containing protein n=1 Tax=Stephania yunnanensis TaxID=152371 RepID=A0AAP0NVZ3_9MAGN
MEAAKKWRSLRAMMRKKRSTLSTKLNILSSDCKKRTMLVAFEYSYSYIPLWDHPLSHCEKIKTATFVPTGGSLDPNDNDWSIRLRWEKPDCRDCEVQGKGCRFKNRTTLVTECFNLIHTPHEGNHSRTPGITGLILGFSFFVLIILSAMKLFYMFNSDEKNQLRIEKFLEDYKALNPTRYTYADLKRITNKFKVTLGEGAYGTVFKGRLSSEIEVAVKMLINSQGNGEEFINEVSIISRIHHVNIVRLVGFCADGYRRALVYEFMQNESLDKYIFLKNNKGKSSSIFLGWQRLQDIAIGIAKGIEYLHQGCDHRILHFDIKPHNILLDRNFNPKISDFGLAKLCSKGESFVSMSAARGTIDYIAPEVLSRNFGNVSYKSDVYSFGMLLLEMVGGRKNTDATVSASQVYFPEWAYKRLEQGREMGFIKAEREGDEEVAKRLTIVALWCIQWYPIDRPSMKSAVQMLEGQVESLSVPPNPFTAAGHNQHASSSTNNNPKTFHPNYGLTAIPEQEECDN